MPRNGSSVYSLPAGNPVIPGTIIATTWANTTLTDIATALTNSLSTDGSTATVSLAGKTMSGGTFSSPTVSGQMALTSGQIAFPAVQVPSAGANVLDDYEEGTWTPAITFAVAGNQNIVYAATRSGTYTKVGRFVYLRFSVETTTFTHTTSTGNVSLTGLPFAALISGTTEAGTTDALNYQGLALGSSTRGFTGYLVTASTLQFLFFTNVDPSLRVSLSATAGHTSGNNVIIAGSISYEAA